MRATLRQHPNLARARQLVAARSAQRRSASAPFDPVLRAELAHVHDEVPLLSAERLDPGERALISDTSSLTVGASAGFQWGMTVIPSVGLERLHQRRDPDLAGFPDAAFQRARADLTVLQPLLRGFGPDGAASELRAAERGLRAAEDTAAHTAQAQAFNAIAAYYRWVAAGSDLRHFRESLARTQKLLEETKELVEAEQRPRADLRQVEASHANQLRGLYEAESNVALARYELALAMGLDGRVLPDWQPADDFPEPRPVAPPAPLAVDQALQARRDLRAAEQTVAEGAELVAGAEQNALPLLDLRVSVGYAGALDDDGVGPFFAAAVENVPGVSAGASLTFELPVENDAQRGALELRRAEQRSAEIERDDLARTVRTSVQSALSELQLSAAALAAAEEAVRLLAQAVSDERDKLREGLSTIIDVVLTEERLTQAELTRTSQRLRHTLAQARLQFERGALPEAEQAVAASAQVLLTQEARHGGR